LLNDTGVAVPFPGVVRVEFPDIKSGLRSLAVNYPSITRARMTITAIKISKRAYSTAD
jgi:hypothetical protein